jgi:hypothetical protein
MNVKDTHDNGIVIRGIKNLTAGMLSHEIVTGTTLAEFLKKECTVLTDGDFKVYSTKNCTFFKCLEENRFINEAHVRSLMESFEKDGYLFTILYVNEKLQIIDGQHRFEAAKRKGLPVHFMIIPKWGLREVTTLNVNSRNWTINDFMEAHAKGGNPNYVRFKEFFDAHEFDVTVCQLIITGQRTRGHAAIDKFRSGQMQVDEQQITDAFIKAKKMLDFKTFHPHGWKSRNFTEATLVLFNVRGYDHSHMVEKLRNYPELLLQEARSLRVEEYHKIFLDKYNFRKQKNKIEIARR